MVRSCEHSVTRWFSSKICNKILTMNEIPWEQDLDHVYVFRILWQLQLMFWKLCCVCCKCVNLLWNLLAMNMWRNPSNTYAFTVTSNNIAAIGIMNSPSQKTGDENRILSMPTKTAANGIDGQKLLKCWK